MWLNFHENETWSMPGPSVPAYETKAPILSSLSFVLCSAIHTGASWMRSLGLHWSLLSVPHCLFSVIILVTLHSALFKTWGLGCREAWVISWGFMLADLRAWCWAADPAGIEWDRGASFSPEGVGGHSCELRIMPCYFIKPMSAFINFLHGHFPSEHTVFLYAMNLPV